MPNDPPHTNDSDEAKRASDELGNNKKLGKWEEPFSIENVACHATLLPNGKVLCWSRRSNPMSPTADMNEQKTNAFLIDMNDPKNPKCSYTKNQPQALNTDSKISESNVSLFCAGHCLQVDGTVFVVGGHIRDGDGAQLANIYDPKTEKWTAQTVPRIGRWYPSALTLPDSSVLTISGSSEASKFAPDQIPQIWRGVRWDENLVTSPPAQGDGGSILPLYPRLHLDPSGRIFIPGPNAQALMVDLNQKSGKKQGKWLPVSDQMSRVAAGRENGASVTYDVGKILWTGGGNGPNVVVNDLNVPGPPTNITEIIDLNAAGPKWQRVKDMAFPRRQHSLTTLPDGTVLVTGGTRGFGFNDLRTGQPVRTPELWNPAAQTWTKMAPESTDRCYHGVAVLLPDGSILSAGSGEGGEFDADPNPRIPNPFRDNHTNAQIFKPPYFFMGEAPQVTGVPAETKYGKSFDVNVSGQQTVGRISWIRLPSVTHGMNSSQSVYFDVLKSPARVGRLK